MARRVPFRRAGAFPSLELSDPQHPFQLADRVNLVPSPNETRERQDADAKLVDRRLQFRQVWAALDASDEPVIGRDQSVTILRSRERIRVSGCAIFLARMPIS
jgi:hypothetical protein